MITPKRLPKSQVPVKYMYQVISTEALSVHKPMIGTVQKLSGFVREVADGFKDTNIIGAIDTLLRKDNNFSRNERAALAYLEKTSYTDLMTLRLPCVPGLSVTWLELLKDLEPGINFVINFYDTTLRQTTQFLGEVLTSPENMDSLARRYGVQEVDFSKLTQSIGNDLNKSGKKGDAVFKDLLSRNTDMSQVISMTNKYSESIFRSNQDLVTERIGNIKRQLEEISDAIVDPNSAFRMSSKNVDQLAKVSFNIAQAVEYYGVILTVFTDHRVSLGQAVAKLAKF